MSTYLVTDTPQWDWVKIKNCMGEEIKKVVIPVGEAHVEVEVPPGCYIVEGHVCEPKMNVDTDRAMVMAGCNQELCVNLIVPKVKTCAIRDIHPFVLEARLANVPEHDIRITTRTIMRAAGISPEEMLERIERKIEVVKMMKGAEEVIKDYSTTLDIIRG